MKKRGFSESSLTFFGVICRSSISSFAGRVDGSRHKLLFQDHYKPIYNPLQFGDDRNYQPVFDPYRLQYNASMVFTLEEVRVGGERVLCLAFVFVWKLSNLPLNRSPVKASTSVSTTIFSPAVARLPCRRWRSRWSSPSWSTRERRGVSGLPFYFFLWFFLPIVSRKRQEGVKKSVRLIRTNLE